jgi:stalled ribosome rescue protein Dom34
MSGKKQFGVWMDTHHATVVSKDVEIQGHFTVIAHIKSETDQGNSNEQTGNNHARTLTTQFFKEIATHMPNVDVLHITGTGQIQEEFAHYLAETPQYKDTVTSDSTANKMSDEALLSYFAERLT